VETTYTSGGTTISRNAYELRDTMLGVSCYFAKAADGKTRCIPQDGNVAYYTDMDCMVPVASKSDSCTPLKYITRIDDTCGGTGVHVHLPGSPVDVTTTKVFISANGSCFEVGAPQDASLTTLGAEVLSRCRSSGKFRSRRVFCAVGRFVNGEMGEVHARAAGSSRSRHLV
jgi:hypothetical protein